MQALRMRQAIAGAGAALVLSAGAAPAQDEASPRVLSARDTLRIDQVGGPALSPDGEWVAYTVRSRDMDDPDLEAVTHVWRVRVDGKRQPPAHARPEERHLARVVAGRQHHRVPRRPRRGGGREDAGALPVRRRGRGLAGHRARRAGGVVRVRTGRLGPAVHGARSAPRGRGEAPRGRGRCRGSSTPCTGMTHLWLHDLGDVRDASPDRGRLHGPQPRLVARLEAGRLRDPAEPHPPTSARRS